jgi:hypothetical protein
MLFSPVANAGELQALLFTMKIDRCYNVVNGFFVTDNNWPTIRSTAICKRLFAFCGRAWHQQYEGKLKIFRFVLAPLRTLNDRCSHFSR